VLGGIAEAQFNLGLCLERGDGTEQDLEQACVQYALAAKQVHNKP
jgi:TPR repeat protein